MQQPGGGADGMAPTAPGKGAFASAHTRDALPRVIWRYRTAGMAFGALAIAAVLVEQGAGPLRWAFCLATGFAWPHIAWWLARRSGSPFEAEQRNLVFDSVLAAAWVPLLHFNLLPSVLLLALPAADKINSDVPGLLRRSVLPALAALLVAGLAAGFVFEPASSIPVILASLPMLLVHTMMVSLQRVQLLRKLILKNEALGRLAQTDVVTGLALRGHWEREAARLLERARADAAPAVLALVDVDGFKQVNDGHGHLAGDALLRAAGALLLRTLRPGDAAGRYGGDEFAVVFPDTTMAEAARLAEAYRAAVQAIELQQAPGLSLSVSIGLAEARPDHGRIEDWIQAADDALYEAKRRGRNRLVVAAAADAPQGDSIA
ncbi:diguanylate cyclase [Luteimonas granuli]|uniref:diguanylate cyclase n=2 Tax=Luteimonas granuli TaxID=1176533 RepID=A0A518N632_9GAMM|nr:diguanylate cyclase [Luteimonas granuli]